MAFPSNPGNGQLATRFGRKYQYNSDTSQWNGVQSIASTTIADIVDEAYISSRITASGTGVTTYSTLAELPLADNTAGAQAFVTESRRLYIWDGYGWFNIAIVNTDPTITTGPSGEYRLSKDGTSTVITLIANDPEGFPITWNYSVTNGSLINGGGPTATVTQVDNVFTITPTTNEAYQGLFNITFTASDGVNLSTATSSFLLNFSVLEYISTKNESRIFSESTTPQTIWFEVADEYTLTIEKNVVADIDLWGGGGGGGASWVGSVNNGGAGGYVYARGIQIPVGTYKIIIGAGGIGGVYASGETQEAMDVNNEDFGNGGLATQGNYAGVGYNNGGVGGGFTGIFAGSVSQANSILIAGGGGGAPGGGSTGSYDGGQGGGDVGSDGRGASPGRGGTQLAGGDAATSSTAGNPGSALQGADGIIGSGFAGGGGGGGYYGGGSSGLNGASGTGGGGGGSGYISTSYTKTGSGFETPTQRSVPLVTASAAPNNTSAGYGGNGNAPRPNANGKDGAIKITITSTY